MIWIFLIIDLDGPGNGVRFTGVDKKTRLVGASREPPQLAQCKERTHARTLCFNGFSAFYRRFFRRSILRFPRFPAAEIPRASVPPARLPGRAYEE